MVRSWLTNLKGRWTFSPRRTPLSRGRRQPCLEQLEERILLDSGLPPALVVGRTLSSSTTDAIQNNQLTITYTVYNQQADPVSASRHCRAGERPVRRQRRPRR